MSFGNIVLGAGASWGDSYLDLPAGAYALSTQAFHADYWSVSVALELTSVYTSSGYHVIVGQCGNATLTSHSTDKWAIGVSSGKLFARVKRKEGTTNSSTYIGTIYDTVVRSAGEKVVVDLTFDGSAFKMYVNGALVGSVTNAVSVVSAAMVGLNCFTDANGLKTIIKAANQKIYALNFYDRALSAEEIETNFKAYNERFALGL